MERVKEKRFFPRRIRRRLTFVIIFSLILTNLIFLTPSSAKAVNCSSTVSYNLKIVGLRYATPGSGVTLYAKIYKAYEEKSKYEEVCVPVVEDITDKVGGTFTWRNGITGSVIGTGNSLFLNQGQNVKLEFKGSIEGQYKEISTSTDISISDGDWITNTYEDGYFDKIKYYPGNSFSVDSNTLKVNSKRTSTDAGFLVKQYYDEKTGQWKDVAQPFYYIWGASPCRDLDKVVVNLDNGIFQSPSSGSLYGDLYGLKFEISKEAPFAKSTVYFTAYYSEKRIDSEQKDVTTPNGQKYRGDYYTCVPNSVNTFTMTTSFSINVLNLYGIVLPPTPSIPSNSGGLFTEVDSGLLNFYFDDTNQKYYKNISINKSGSGPNLPFTGLNFKNNIEIYNHRGDKEPNLPNGLSGILDEASSWRPDGTYISGVSSPSGYTVGSTKVGKGWLEYVFDKSKLKGFKLLKCTYLPLGQRDRGSDSECSSIDGKGLKVGVAKSSDPNPSFTHRIAVWDFNVQSQPSFPSSCDNNNNAPYAGSKGLFFYYLQVPGLYDIVNKIKLTVFSYLGEFFSNAINLPERIVQGSTITITDAQGNSGVNCSSSSSNCQDFIRMISSLGSISSPTNEDRLCGGSHCSYSSFGYTKIITWPKNSTVGQSLPPGSPIWAAVWYLLPELSNNGLISNASNVKSLVATEETGDNSLKTYFPRVEYNLPNGCFRRVSVIIKGDVYSAKGFRSEGIVFKPLSEEGGSIVTIASSPSGSGVTVEKITNNPDLKAMPFYNFETKEIFSSSESAASALTNSILIRRIYELKEKGLYLYSARPDNSVLTGPTIREGFLVLENQKINLNPSGPSSGFLSQDATGADVDKTRPGGRIWVVDGNLELNNVTYKGNGAIIVTGAIRITGSLKKDTSDPNASLTLISLYKDQLSGEEDLAFKTARKAIEITDNTSPVNAFLFAPFGYVSTGGGSGLDFTGAIVASKIHFGRDGVMKFTYDDKAIRSIPREISKLFESQVMVR